MADILIRGIEMPEDRRITIQIGADGAVYFVEKCTIMAEKYEKSSHAVPLPAGHGRLIDADAFLATIRPLCTEDTQAACTLETVKQLMVKHISSAPTIVPAEGDKQ